MVFGLIAPNDEDAEVDTPLVKALLREKWLAVASVLFILLGAGFQVASSLV